jgi:spore coat protein CotH
MKSISRLKIILLASIIIASWNARAQENFYDISTIQQIEISFYQSNWDYIMDTAKAGSGSYLMSRWVRINGVQFDSAGVKYKGSSSYDPTFAKNPLHISLDEFKNQSYQGFTSVKLANFYGDPSMIREPLAYSVLSNYMDCPRSNFAEVTVNGTLIGLYSNDESVNKKFCSTHFYSTGNTFIKGSPILPGPYSKSDLKYISADSSDYFSKYELESDHGWNDLVDLCYMLKYDIGSIEENIDIDRALWMLAFNNVLVSLDSYSGWFAQNHYLYKDNTGHYNPVIWDLNMAFGGFPFAGTQSGGSGSLTVEQMKQMTPLLHDNHNDWPLIFVLMSNPLWKKMYIAHMRTIIEENFSNSEYFGTASEMMVMIANSVQLDQNKFFTDEQFFESLTTDITFGSYVIPGIQNLMDARAEYLLAADIFSDSPPVIANVVSNTQEPDLGDAVTILATVTGEGALNVFLGVRHDKEDKFVRQAMYDDGNHGDGAAGDGNYGASFTMTSLTAQYYIYAEIGGADVFAATFSPERAEHEFYSLSAAIPTAQPGDVVINEFLARNNNDTVNEYGNHEDWIELVNLTNDPVDLFGLYLTDDYDNPDKFDFPENTIIEPHGYILIWADEEDTASGFLHANFKLSGDGEKLMLSDGAALVLDSLSFGPQTADFSLGRCPDGTGFFDELEITTYGFTNFCPDGYADHLLAAYHVLIVPNPVTDRFTIITDIQGNYYFEVYNASGCVILREQAGRDGEIFNTEGFTPGLYFYLVKDASGRILSSGKLLKL